MYYFGDIKDGNTYVEEKSGKKYTLGELAEKWRKDEDLETVAIYDNCGDYCGTLNPEKWYDMERLINTALEYLYGEGPYKDMDDEEDGGPFDYDYCRERTGNYVEDYWD